MNPDAMSPYGRALLAFFEGDAAAEIVVRRDDGFAQPLPASFFFREPAGFSELELAALHACRGHVLDVGAGSGLHALALQARGVPVTAIDVSPQAVDIMTRRGVRDVRQADVLRFEDGPFDTLLMLGHGLGMVGDLAGLERLLDRAGRLLRDDGQALVHSLDVLRTTDARHLAYHEANRRAGRYVGEVRLSFEYRGARGPECKWVHVDPRTLAERAGACGWACETIREEPTGDYLARLQRVTGESRE